MVRVSLVLMGTAGSGKTEVGTTLAQALGARFIEGDRFHPPLNVAKMAAGDPLTAEDRWPWLRALANELARAHAEGEAVVMSCSALRRAYRDVLRTGDPTLQFVHLAADLALLQRRIEGRTGHFMPASLLASQLATLESPSPDENAWTVEVSPPVSVIVATLLDRVQQAQAGEGR
jgi:carbohydrate kinase (thermoresistant glucokinase family)